MYQKGNMKLLKIEIIRYTYKNSNVVITIYKIHTPTNSI